MKLDRANRRAFVLGSGSAVLLASSSRATNAPPFVLDLAGTPMQSGLLIGTTLPGSVVRIDGLETKADTNGKFVIGFDRDAPPQAFLSVTTTKGEVQRRTLSIAPRTYPSSTVNGLPPGTVDPPPEVAARIAREVALKNAAFTSLAPGEGFLERFDWPVPPSRITSKWGAQRILNGSKQRPHYGVDIGVPTGTPIRAPAPGLVILAEPDMWFEGGMTAIDHGQGLQTIYLHQSRIDVKAGQTVTRGAVIGAVGAKGRATGPHLCWRMRWRGRQCDPTLRTL